MFTNFDNTVAGAVNGDSWIYSGYAGLERSSDPENVSDGQGRLHRDHRHATGPS